MKERARHSVTSFFGNEMMIIKKKRCINQSHEHFAQGGEGRVINEEYKGGGRGRLPASFSFSERTDEQSDS